MGQRAPSFPIPPPFRPAKSIEPDQDWLAASEIEPPPLIEDIERRADFLRSASAPPSPEPTLDTPPVIVRRIEHTANPRNVFFCTLAFLVATAMVTIVSWIVYAGLFYLVLRLTVDA